jgi:hypothetical protein
MLGVALSEGQLQPPNNANNQERQAPPIINNTTYEALTTQALLARVVITQNQQDEPNETIDINNVRSEHLLLTEMTPFTEEGELPPFQHGSLGLHYFQILRGVLSKHIRAAIHLETLEENQRRHQIPRGLKINKNLNAVDPTYQLKLKHMQIMGKAEIEMLISLIEHYHTIIPKLMADFTTLFNDASTLLNPVDKRLVVIKLLHYKNELISERKTVASRKLATQQDRPLQPPPENPNGCTPQMGQQETDQNYNQQRTNQTTRTSNRPSRTQNYQQNNLYRPRSQQRNRDWDEEQSTERWQEEPREQRQNRKRGRGRGRT